MMMQKCGAGYETEEYRYICHRRAKISDMVYASSRGVAAMPCLTGRAVSMHDRIDAAAATLACAALAATGLFFSCSLAAQQVPQQLQPPAGEQVLIQVHAKGDQVYVCKEGVTEFAWNLKAPDAQLFDKDDKPFGRHFAGPSWEAKDGSKVVGKAVANVPSPDADSIPWLLVNIVSHEGSGVLSRATSIQRINTKGGKAPASGCDSVHVGQELRVAYSADYVFYSAR